MTAALKHATAGRPGGVLVGGEAGVGKTRLLEELAARAERRGALVLVGRCFDSLSDALPLLPIADALAPLGATSDHELPPALTRLVGPASRRRAPGDDIGSDHLFAAVAGVLRRRSLRGVVLLILEDLQWADRATLALLTFLTRRLDDERLLLVASYRSDELDRHDELREFLAGVARTGTLERLHLRPLSSADAARCLKACRDGPLDPAWARAVLTRAEGNPLFIEQLAMLGPGQLQEALPATLRDMLLARMRRLEPDAQRIVRAAAASGRWVHHRVLAAVVDLPEAALDRGLREAVLHRILVPTGDGYAFRQPLQEEVAYRELLPGERMAVHAALAQFLTAHPELAGGAATTPVAQVAHHLRQAGDRPRALAAAVQAGAEAERLHAPGQAGDEFTRALALWDDVDDAERLTGLDRAALLSRAAGAAADGGHHADAIQLVDAALTLVDPSVDPLRAGRLHECRARYLWFEGRPEAAVAASQEAVRRIPAVPPTADRASAVAGLGLLLVLHGRDPVEARERCEEAITVARRAGARVEEAEATVALALAPDPLGDPAAGIADLRRARERGRSAGAPRLQALVALHLSHVLRRTGDLREAVDMALEGAEVCRAAGLDFAEGGLCRAAAAEAAFELGDWVLAAELTDQQLDRGAAGITRIWVLQIRAMLDVARGDFDAADAVGDELQALSSQTRSGQAVQAARQETEAALWRGDPGAALTRAESALALVAVGEPEAHDELLALAMRAAADIAARVRDHGDKTAAAAAIGRARALRHPARAGPAADPARLMVDAELSRAAERPDPEPWDAVIRGWEACPSPHRGAYARWRRAEALLAAGAGRGEVKEVLRPAYEVAVTLGARPLLEEIVALARRGRITLDVPAVAVAGTERTEDEPFGLTPRELEVLELVALGQTNRQIATALFISTKTAGVHLSHILAKLGAGTRGEAAAIARRHRLVP
jgi:DNA-binding CsgD family transcriptional regulator/tetratricopeptide (TPR) repeat protein